MKKLILLTLLFGMTSTAFGEVSAEVYLADGNTPLEYQDIMVGTKLTIIVDSDVAEDWSGSLVIEDANRNYGELSGRGYDGFSYADSCREAAGLGAAVWDWEAPGIDGFDLYTGFANIAVDDYWFIIDYNATNVGDCNVGFYKHNPPFDSELLYYLEFSHVRTRNFNNDTKVDFGDFAILASYWQYPTCGDSNDCQGSDLDINGTVDANDVMLFTDYWLEKTE